jgi:hypothetical protein
VNLPDLLSAFAARIEREHAGVRVIRHPSAGSSWVRVLLAPAERIRDDIPEAQRERQRSAGALAPEVFGHDLFEIREGLAPLVRTWTGGLVPVLNEETARALLSAFFDPRTDEGKRLAVLAGRIREGAAEARRGSIRSPGAAP